MADSGEYKSGGAAPRNGGRGAGGPRGGRSGNGGRGPQGSRDGQGRRGDRKPYKGGGERDGKRQGGRSFDRRDGERSFQGGKKPYRGKRDGAGDDRERRWDGGKPRRDEGGKRPTGDRKPYRGDRTHDRRDRRDDRAGRTPNDARASSETGAQTRKPNGYAGELERKRSRSRSKASPARLAALDAVRTVRERGAFAQDVIAQDIDRSHMLPEDRAFATKLVLGSVSAQGTLDEIINMALDDPTDISPGVRDALRLSVYEIMFLGKIPHAAVDQGVELVRSYAPPACGLANAVLRKVVRLRAEFPFADPSRDLDALARANAFPSWLARRLIADLGPQAALDFMRASNDQAPLFMAANAAKTDEDAVLRSLERVEETADPVYIDGAKVAGCLRAADTRSLLLPEVKRLFGTGRVLVSDAASQLVAASVLPEERPASLLEVGAGRATKTILLQGDACRRWGAQIEEYVAIDNHGFKTKLLTERAKRYGVHVSEAVTGDVLEIDELMPERMFDVVFVDAPCSGLGTLRRHPEIRWRVRPEDVERFAAGQLAMLKAVSSHVNVGGTLAYATCTVTRQENNGVVKAFLDSEEGASFKLAPIAGRSCIATRLTPGSPDAHFAVRFVRVK